MRRVFLESHNIKNPFFGFGQFNYHLVKGIYTAAPEDFKMSLHVKHKNKWSSEFGDFFKLKKYHSLRRYPQARIRTKYNLWHAMNQNTKIEPYHNIPYLLTVHNITHIKNSETFMEKEVHQRFQEKLHRSTAITYISEYAKSSTHQYFEVPEVPEHIIYNGNPITKIQLSEIYQPKGVPTRPFLFSIGEFTARKNFKTLIEMLRVLPDFDLVIAGKNSTKEAENMRSLVEKYQFQDRITFPGKISEMDKQWYYQNCTAFVFPSLREGFGLPIIEAMRFEKPVIASNNTSIPEIGSDIAFYWEHYDPEYMAQTVTNALHTFEQDQSTYKKRSLERAQSFNWNDAAKQYIDVYRSLL